MENLVLASEISAGIAITSFGIPGETHFLKINDRNLRKLILVDSLPLSVICQNSENNICRKINKKKVLKKNFYYKAPSSHPRPCKGEKAEVLVLPYNYMPIGTV